MVKKTIIAVVLALIAVIASGVYWRRRCLAPVNGKSSVQVQRERAHAIVEERFGNRGEIVGARRSSPKSYKNIFIFRIPGHEELKPILVDANSSEVRIIQEK